MQGEEHHWTKLNMDYCNCLTSNKKKVGVTFRGFARINFSKRFQASYGMHDIIKIIMKITATVLVNDGGIISTLTAA